MAGDLFVSIRKEVLGVSAVGVRRGREPAFTDSLFRGLAQFRASSSLSPPNGCLRTRKLNLHDLPRATQSAGGLAEGHGQVSFQSPTLLGQPGCGLEITDVCVTVPTWRADPAAGEQEPEKTQSADSTRVPLPRVGFVRCAQDAGFLLRFVSWFHSLGEEGDHRETPR